MEIDTRPQATQRGIHSVRSDPALSAEGYARGMTSRLDRIRTFRQLHESGCFVMPNPWDIGSARMLVRLGFHAVATTSAGFAWSVGRPDYGVTLEQVLDHLQAIANAVDVPVNADF